MTELWRQFVPGHNVVIYGDYDVDGVSSSNIAYRLAQWSNAKSLDLYIPIRSKEGYGLNLNAAQQLADRCETVIVTDCGTKDVEAVQFLRSKGVKVLIFDHHQIEGNVAAPDCLLNPQLDGDENAKTLCATGVIWCWAFFSGLFPLSALDQLTQLAGLATVADCMPLGELNQGLVRRGLALTNQQPLQGLADLYQTFSLNLGWVTENDWTMKVIPCLNAAGRVGDAKIAFKVLFASQSLVHDGVPVGVLAQLIQANQTRKNMSSQISSEIGQRFEQDGVQVFFNNSWPAGMLSGIASRLCSKFGRGFVLASAAGDVIRGTVRVPEGANAVSLLKKYDQFLEHWGGHPAAAGFSVVEEKWAPLANLLNKELSTMEVPELLEKVILFDPTNLRPGDLQDLRRLAPFGKGNEEPLFFMPRQEFHHLSPLGDKGLHAKIRGGGQEFLAFNGAQQLKDMGRIAGWLYRPRINVWNDQKRVQNVIEKLVLAE